jgi:hypothetical protein
LGAERHSRRGGGGVGWGGDACVALAGGGTRAQVQGRGRRKRPLSARPYPRPYGFEGSPEAQPQNTYPCKIPGLPQAMIDTMLSTLSANALLPSSLMCGKASSLVSPFVNKRQAISWPIVTLTSGSRAASVESAHT